MSQPVDDVRIHKFQQDRNLLPYNDAEIAVRITISKSNYSSYVNGRYPITNAFLKKFYLAFEEELKELRKKNTVGEEEQPYKHPKHLDREIEELKKKNRDIEGKCDRLLESNQLLSMNIYRLEKKMDNIEILLSHMASQAKNSTEKFTGRKK